MIIHSAFATNFQSYAGIGFEYTDLGLALIYGPTGAGKSTLFDLVPYTLFGVTSKDGSADSVRSWDATAPTEACVNLTLPDGGEVSVHRVRGKGAQNDLYWNEMHEEHPKRGKDLSETQRLLNARLGVDADLFLTGSYLTQFSSADTFFVASAKERRKVLDKIADQSFPIKLGERLLGRRKTVKAEVGTLELRRSSLEGKIDAIEGSLHGLRAAQFGWDESHQQQLDKAQYAADNFAEVAAAALKELNQKAYSWELDKAQRLCDLDRKAGRYEQAFETDAALVSLLAQLQAELAALPDATCETCGGPKLHDRKDALTRDYQDAREAWQNNKAELKDRERVCAQILDLEKQVNPYTEALGRPQTNPHTGVLERIKKEVNPYGTQIEAAGAKVKLHRGELSTCQADLTAQSSNLFRLNWLYDKAQELRGVLMQNAVDRVQDSTNGYLERHFDAQIRVAFSLSDSDRLEVEITNDGHLCPFSALSGGERCLLKLAFTLSLMRAAQDKAGAAFSAIFLDEPLNGLDGDLKAKAFGLLQELATQYPTVLVVEHSEELKTMFTKHYLVAKVSGHSTIVEDV